jgi:hypothetical protein
MRRRFRRNLAFLLIAGASLGGCVQATRHSNTMVFGTNTAFGLTAGQDVSGIPSVTVGYRRQEAVVMPLVANTQDNGSYQTPCPVGDIPDSYLGSIPPCLLVARYGNAIDTYSVLASFGARFGGSARTTDASGSGGLAQFFSTGIAAQFLAINGGAALVAISEAAEEPPSPGEVTAMQTLANTAGLQQQILTVSDANIVARANATAYLQGLPAAEFTPRFAAFAQSLGLPSDYCTNLSQADCLAKMTARSELRTRDAPTITAALNAARAVTIAPPAQPTAPTTPTTPSGSGGAA